MKYVTIRTGQRPVSELVDQEIGKLLLNVMDYLCEEGGAEDWMIMRSMQKRGHW